MKEFEVVEEKTGLVKGLLTKLENIEHNYIKILFEPIAKRHGYFIYRDKNGNYGCADGKTHILNEIDKISYMESVFKINNFNELSVDTQKEIQDYVAGITTNYTVEFFSHCDACGEEKPLNRVETEGGIIRVCSICEKKLTNVSDKSLVEFVE